MGSYEKYKNADLEFSEAGNADKKKPTKRQLQAAKTKDKIYDAAVREFNNKGFNKVSIEDITRAANVAKGSFYTHFRSKGDLVLYSFHRADEAYLRAYEGSEGLDFLDRMLFFLEAYYSEFQNAGKELTKAIVSSYYETPENNYFSRKRILVQCFTKIIDQGKKEKKLDPNIDSGDYVNMFLSTLIGIEILWCYDDSHIDLSSFIHETMGTLASGMIKRYEDKLGKRI